MVDKQLLARLFQNPKRNRNEICQQLYELADIVASKVVTEAEKEDVRSELFAWVLKRIDRYDTSKGSSAYSYFYCIMERESWKIANLKRLLPMCGDARLAQEEDGTIGLQKEGSEPATFNRICDLEPIMEKPTQPTTPVKLLDKTIRKCKTQQAKYPEQSQDYRKIAIGLSFLKGFQELLRSADACQA